MTDGLTGLFVTDRVDGHVVFTDALRHTAQPAGVW